MYRILLILLLLLPVYAENHNDVLVLHSVTGENSFTSFYLQNLFNRIADSLDFTPVYVHYPLKRAILSINEGKIDIEMARSGVYEEMNPLAHKVPVTYFSTKMVAYSLDTSLHLDGWESLAEDSFKIDYMRGAVISLLRLENEIPLEDAYEVNNINSGMRRLLFGRSDLLICGEPHGKGWLLNHPDLAKSIHIAGVMENIEIFAYVPDKNRHLIEPLSRVLQSLKDEGEIMRLWRENLKTWSQ